MYVIPKLGASAPTRATHGTSFTVKGSSTPNMHGVKVQLQERRSTGGSWHTVVSVAVGKRGTFAHAVSFSTTGPAYVRWHYAGGTSKPWMAAASVARKVSIV